MNSYSFAELNAMYDFAVEQRDKFQALVGQAFNMLDESNENNAANEKLYSDSAKEVEIWDDLANKLREIIKQKLTDFTNN